MSTAILNPTAATAPPRLDPQPFRWTIAQYHELGKTKLFDDVKTMLIDGEIFTTVFPRPPHDVAIGLTHEFLRIAFPTGYHVRNQMGFDIGTRHDPGPDLAVVPGSIRDYSTKTPTAAILVVEVAETAFFFDTTTKAELYATAGVPDY